MRLGRVVLIVVGTLAGLFGLALAGGGIALLWVDSHRDAQGFLTAGPGRVQSDARAIVSHDINIGVPDWLTDDDRLATVRIDARSERPVFVGIARSRDANAYLAGVAVDRVDDLEVDPLALRLQRGSGARAPPAPGGQTIWVARATGTGPVSLRWEVRDGNYTAVLMNADAQPGIAVTLSLGARVEHLRAFGVGLIVAGAIALGAGVLMIVLGVRRQTPADETEVGDPPANRELPYPAAAPAGAYPVQVEGTLQPDLSRWLWLVKWLLAIPHLIVLAFLWIAVGVMTLVSLVAILITGRYPRPIFGFTVGVMRWTWRVAFYGYAVLGTDRYPPFSLDARPGDPATLEIPYPEHLSRGRVLVKSWLLAIPHLAVTSIFVGGWPFAWGFGWASGWDDDWLVPGPWWGGLIGVLALFAGVALLFTGRYPESIFRLLAGLSRWVFRVLAYVLLLRDEYPPFRLER